MGSYIKNLMIAFDRLGNALADGDPDATVSGRTGHFAETATGPRGSFWRALAAMIDWGFLPWDGPDHCARVARAERALPHIQHRPGSDPARVLLLLLAMPVGVLAGVSGRLLRLANSA
ncbi:hypothetical protein [Microbulbifer discodermiae]|uniref:hypothetical protein n=1 Tax=Microbulbifer sp. 2201CG32-9 TaxID=3232309 RepID=UPI00345B5EF1